MTPEGTTSTHAIREPSTVEESRGRANDLAYLLVSLSLECTLAELTVNEAARHSIAPCRPFEGDDFARAWRQHLPRHPDGCSLNGAGDLGPTIDLTGLRPPLQVAPGALLYRRVPRGFGRPYGQDKVPTPPDA